MVTGTAGPFGAIATLAALPARIIGTTVKLPALALAPGTQAGAPPWSEMVALAGGAVPAAGAVYFTVAATVDEAPGVAIEV